MRIAGWDIEVDLCRNAWRHGWAHCFTYRQAEGKTLCFTIAVPWLLELEVSFYGPRVVPVPMMYVDISGTIAVPQSLGKHAGMAVLDALIEVAEARHWECSVGASVSKNNRGVG